MDETATTLPARATGLPRVRAVTDELDRRLFVGGVSAITLAVAVFLFIQLDKWPPHEDETLPLFVGRHSLTDAFDIVLAKRGGAPLHFLLAWIVAHTGGGLHEMRLLSALFAVASIPAIAILGNRLTGRAPALAAAALAAGSWVLLFHGIYARMYSLFLFLATVSYLALLRALKRGGWSAWALWGLTMLLTIAAHQYGALVLASQGLYVLATRERWRQAIPAFAAVGILAIPLWRASLILADRYDVGGGGSSGALSTPHQVFAYLWHVAGDSSSGYTGVLVVYLLLAVVGLAFLARDRPRGALLVGCVVLTPTLFFLIGKFGGSSAPQSRHLIFVLPFLALAAGSGIVGLARLAGPRGAWLAVAVVAALVVAEIGWGKHKTPALFGSEGSARVHARAQAAEWLAQTARPDDVLFAYEPLYLAAWERHRSAVSNIVVPRADPKLLDRALREAGKPLGRGVWVFDAGDNNNYVKRNRIELRLPFPTGEFEGRAYGPYLVIRTRKPTRTIAHYLDDARKAELIGKSLGMGDADINYATIRSAQVRELVRSRSSVSS
jgi:4-amino-4-deoxy-L-arabinose transferase-like glycosyltransferase